MCQHVSLLYYHPFPKQEKFSIFLDATQAHSSCRQLPVLHCLSNEPTVIKLWTHFYIYLNLNFLQFCNYKHSEYFQNIREPQTTWSRIIMQDPSK